MHGAADTAQHFLVGRPSLEIETGFVQGLQNLRGGLKKERTEFGATILGEIAHKAASRR